MRNPRRSSSRRTHIGTEGQRWQLVTTNAVVVETHALLLNRTRERRTLAIKFLDDLESSELRVERAEEDDKAAIALVRAHKDKTYSLCDGVGVSRPNGSATAV